MNTSKNLSKEKVLSLLTQQASQHRDAMNTWNWFEEDMPSINELKSFRDIDQDELFPILQSLVLEEGNYQAAIVYYKLNSSAANQLLTSHIGEMSSAMQSHICGLIGDRGGNGGVEILLKLMQSNDSNVRYNAIFALGRVGDERVLPALRTTAENDKGEDYEGFLIAEAAEKAIGKIVARSSAKP